MRRQKRTPRIAKRKPGRPPAEIKMHPIALRVHPDVLDKLRDQADDEGIGYQTLINRVLAKHVGVEVSR